MEDLKIPLHERIPYLIWSCGGFAEKERLYRLLELDFDRRSWVDAYEWIGVPTVAGPLHAIISRYPDPFPEDDEAVQNEPLKSELDLAEDKLFSASKDIEAKLAGFVRHHLDQYQDLVWPSDSGRGWEFGNVGYLASMAHRIDEFANEHGGRIPTVEELETNMLRRGFKQAVVANYRIVLTGQLADQEKTAPLIILNRPILGQQFCLTVEGRIEPYPR